MLSSANAFGVNMVGGFGFSGALGSTRGFAAMNVVKVCLIVSQSRYNICRAV